ncbi:UNVERIFIED_CONTAM: hypothetical protein H355_013305 [Colinus virginianus]|nr:hypothetical protein H355_013305 [Colinus virginianus]
MQVMQQIITNTGEIQQIPVQLNAGQLQYIRLAQPVSGTQETLISVVKHGLGCLLPSTAKEKASPPRAHQRRKRNRSNKHSHKRRHHRGGRHIKRALNGTHGHPEKPYFAIQHQEVTTFLRLFGRSMLDTD